MSNSTIFLNLENVPENVVVFLNSEGTFISKENENSECVALC